MGERGGSGWARCGRLRCPHINSTPPPAHAQRRADRAVHQLTRVTAARVGRGRIRLAHAWISHRGRGSPSYLLTLAAVWCGSPSCHRLRLFLDSPAGRPQHHPLKPPHVRLPGATGHALLQSPRQSCRDLFSRRCIPAAGVGQWGCCREEPVRRVRGADVWRMQAPRCSVLASACSPRVCSPRACSPRCARRACDRSPCVCSPRARALSSLRAAATAGRAHIQGSGLYFKAAPSSRILRGDIIFIFPCCSLFLVPELVAAPLRPFQIIATSHTAPLAPPPPHRPTAVAKHPRPITAVCTRARQSSPTPVSATDPSDSLSCRNPSSHCRHPSAAPRRGGEHPNNHRPSP